MNGAQGLAGGTGEAGRRAGRVGGRWRGERRRSGRRATPLAVVVQRKSWNAWNLCLRDPSNNSVGRLIVSALTAAALSAGCNGNGNGDDAFTPTSPNAAKLHVLQVWDETVGLYVEGARSYIAVETRGGRELLELELRQTAEGYEQAVRLDPGDYRLLSWQRPSSGGGDYDPPTDRCSAPFTLTPDEPIRVRIEVRAAEGCTIEFQ
jgi:hypothetical protein